MISLDNLRTVLNAIKRTLDSTKQDKLIAGKNITIAADGKTISATNCSDKILSVTITGYTDEEVVADKTYAEIKAAIDSGYPIHTINRHGDIFVPRVNFESTVERITLAWTERLDSNTWAEIVYEVNTQDSWGVTLREFVNPAEIGNLNALKTQFKDNLVVAINEVKQATDNKQDKLIAGENITIAADGKTISATGGSNASITMRVNGGYIQYSTDNGKTWSNLIAEADLSPNITIEETASGVMIDVTNPDGSSSVGYVMDGQDAYDAAKTGGYTDTQANFYADLAATQGLASALAGKVDKVTGKGLSTNDYTNAAKAKVDAIPADPKYTDTVYDDTAVRDSLSSLATMTELNTDRIETIESELDGNVPGTTLYSLTTKGEVEIYGDQPHLDFHYNNSTEDYTSRIIETASGRLNLSASNGVQINGKETENQAVTLTVNANRITNLAYTAKYNELLGAVFVRIYGKINASMSVGYGYTVFNIGNHLPNAVAALSVKIGSDASTAITKKAAAYAQSNGAINLQPLDEGLNGYDIYITGFWFV